MKRRTVLAVLATLPSFRAYVAAAQSPAKIPRIGFLTGGPPGTFIEEFRKALQAVGYVDGKNVVIEARYSVAPGRSEAAEELVRLNVDIIATTDTAPALAAQRATKTIPIVGGLGADPVAAGLVASLARPGANITGTTTNSPALGGKRLELLKEVAAQISPVAVLWIPSSTGGNRFQMRGIESAARDLSLELQPAAVHGTDDFESAFSAIEKGGARSLIVLGSPLFTTERSRIVGLATKSRLPAIYPAISYVDAGGLMSYAHNADENVRRQAVYIDRILKGAKPADLPVEAPSKFELVVNLKTAKQIGVTIPESMLQRADRVIQ